MSILLLDTIHTGIDNEKYGSFKAFNLFYNVLKW